MVSRKEMCQIYLLLAYKYKTETTFKNPTSVFCGEK